MDHLIVVTTSERDALFWKRRLPHAIVVSEDWPGGAGNGLGTLYAFQKACQDVDLIGALEQGAFVAMVHTAGRGSRLFPLPLSEGGSKSAVRVASPVDLTLLEAVIQQADLVRTRWRGRLGVFWGDQVFVPSVPLAGKPRHNVEILGQVLPAPDPVEWENQGWNKYGLLIESGDEAIQLEKLSQNAYKKIYPLERCARSLGSFGVTVSCLIALMETFAKELIEKKEKLDTDPHFWMPATAGQLYSGRSDLRDRMACISEQFYPFLGILDVGPETYFWDFGNLQSFYACHQKLLGSGSEAIAMRKSFGLPEPDQEGNIVVGCQIDELKCRHSLLAHVSARRVEAENVVILHSHADTICGKENLIYRLQGDLQCQPRQVCIDAKVGARRERVSTTLDRDGKKDWSVCLRGNSAPYSTLADLQRHVADDIALAHE